MSGLADSPGEYPECEHWAAVADDAALIEDFLSWRGDQAVTEPDHVAIKRFFGVDTAKLEAERRQILAKARGGA